MSEKLRALGINIFGGGFTLGVLQSGHFNVVGQWEECNAGARTFDLNTRYFAGIPRPIGYDNWDFLSCPRPNLIYANPPCAVWSSANTYQGGGVEARMRDPRLKMTSCTMETALAMRPDTFVSESVCNAFTMGRVYYDTWAEKFLADGYGVTYYLTDALLLGVPSTRQRFHFIAHRRELGLPGFDGRAFMARTVRAAIGDIENDFGHLPQHIPHRLSPETHELMGMCAPGRQLNLVEEERRAAGRAPAPKPSFLVKKLLWDAPAFTMIKLSDGCVHPGQPRYLTEREGLRLCGYPDDFVVAQHQGATQAVLPPLGLHLATLARESMDRGPAQAELEVVDHRDRARPYRPGAVREQLEGEL